MEKKTVKKSAQKPTKADNNCWAKCYDRTPFDCNWCGLKFDSSRKLKVHERTSHLENIMCNFTCNICYNCDLEIQRILEKDCRNLDCPRIYEKLVKSLCDACSRLDFEKELEKKFESTARLRFRTVSIKRGLRNF